MFKLVRDEIPNIIKKNGQVCNFAQVQNPELMTAFLREKLVEELSEFLRANPASKESLEELVDIVTVVRAIYKFGGIDDKEFEALCADKLAKNGGFENRFIMFIPDPVQQGEVKKDE